jgi:hypothetical protein
LADYAVEKLDSAFSALNAMLPAQWAHTGDSDVPLQPNWPLYRALEARNALFVVLAREEGRPVGYMVAFLYPHPNAVSVPIAEIKTYYVERVADAAGNIKGRAIVLNSMIDFTLAELARREAYKIKAWTHAEHSAGRIWERKGFEIAEIGYTLKLKGKPDA